MKKKIKIVLGDKTLRLLKDSISIMKDFVTEIKLNIKKTEMNFVVMDCANVAMAVWRLFDSACTVFDVEEETSIGILLVDFNNILKAVKSNFVTLEYDGEKLSITTNDKTPRKFKLQNIGIDMKDEKIPELKFDTSIFMSSRNFCDIINDSKDFGQKLTFECKNNLFVISCQNDLCTEFNVEIKSTNEAKITANENCISKYSTEYLLKFIKSYRLSNNVKIAFGADCPLKLSYVAQNILELNWILAPRVGSE